MIPDSDDHYGMCNTWQLGNKDLIEGVAWVKRLVQVDFFM
jgi:hypothetical protein